MLWKRKLRNEKSEDDLGIYGTEEREILLEDDELSPVEEAFMSGYEDI